MRESGQAYRSRLPMPQVGFPSKGAISFERGCWCWFSWVLVPGPGVHIWIKGTYRRLWCLVTTSGWGKVCVVHTFSTTLFKHLCIIHYFYRLQMITFRPQCLQYQNHLPTHSAPFKSWASIWPIRKQALRWSDPGKPSSPPFTRASLAYVLIHSVTQAPNWPRALKSGCLSCNWSPYHS